MGDKKNEPPAEVPAKGYWLTPQQRYDSLRYTWRKLEYEKVDLEAILSETPISYFNRPKRSDKLSEYDRVFHCNETFDPKKKREDRGNIDLIHNRIVEEESQRIFPVVVSHTYGHRKGNLEGKTYISHKKVETMSETKRRWYANLKPTKKLPQDIKMETL